MNSTDDRKAKVFISHKHEDALAAIRLGDILNDRTGQLEVFLSERILPGEEWTKWIRTKLKESDLLLLLYTNPSAKWDWPLFEAGLFTSLEEEDRRRVVCLYPAGSEAPRPLKNLQAVPVVPVAHPKNADSIRLTKEANRSLIENFITPFYHTGDLTDGKILNDTLTPERIGDIAVKVAELFAPTQIQQGYYAKRILLEYPQGVSISDQDIPDEVRISVEEGDLAIFDVASQSCNWGNLKQWIDETGHFHWVKELARNISRVAKGGVPRPVTGTFRGAKDGNIYRPILYRADRTGDRPFRFLVLLSEQPSPHFIGGPGDAGTTFNMLRLGNRFRWEVVEPYLSKLLYLPPGRKVDPVLRLLREGIILIEEEASALGFLIPANVSAAFDRGDDKQEISEMFTLWERVRDRLFKGIEANDVDEVKQELLALKNLNDRFTEIASRRYHELVEKGA
jgi:hypothetical protein